MTDTFEQKTIRDPLLGMVADHFGKGQINCGVTHQVGCELVALLSAYREEERRLFPQVYLFGPSEADLIRAIAPGIPVLTELRTSMVSRGEPLLLPSRLARHWQLMDGASSSGAVTMASALGFFGPPQKHILPGRKQHLPRRASLWFFSATVLKTL